MAATSLTSRQLSFRFILCIICYFSLHILLRIVISDSLEYDEAEQALLSQWLRPGYTEQPPLYTWIQHFLFLIFGKTVFAISLLKNSLLCLTYVCLFFSARILFGDTRSAILAACSLLLLPQIGWEIQRDMTHTALAVCAASATLLQCLRMIKKQRLRDFIILGVLLSIGILAKVNFLLFILILWCCLLSFDEGRRFLLSPKMVVVLLIITILTGPYFYWMYGNQDIVFSATNKFKRAAENYYLKGTVSLLKNSFLFVTPLWLIFLCIFPSAIVPRIIKPPAFQDKFSLRYLALFFTIMLVVVLLFKVTTVKQRWLQPLLFLAPLFFFSRLEPGQISRKQFRYFLVITFVFAVGLYAAFAVRVVGASYIKQFCRMNYPMTAMASDMRDAGFAEGLIISNNRFLAGNMLLQFPESAAIVPDYRFEELVKTRNFSQIALVWKGDYYPRVPESLVSFMKDKYDIDVKHLPPKSYEHTYKYGKEKKVTLAAIYISHAKSE